MDCIRYCEFKDKQVPKSELHCSVFIIANEGMEKNLSEKKRLCALQYQFKLCILNKQHLSPFLYLYRSLDFFFHSSSNDSLISMYRTFLFCDNSITVWSCQQLCIRKVNNVNAVPLITIIKLNCYVSIGSTAVFIYCLYRLGSPANKLWKFGEKKTKRKCTEKTVFEACVRCL